MPIAAADVKLKFTTKAGAAGNANAGTADGSLGKYISTTEITDNNLHNLFDIVSAAENVASESEYRCIAIHNSHATLTLQGPKAFLFSEVAGGASIAIGIDPTAASAIGAAPAQAVEVANENTAPAGVAFTSPTTFAAGVAIGDLAPGQCRMLWVRRTAANTAALTNDNCVLRFQGESF